MLSGVRGGKKKKQKPANRELSLPLGLLLSKRNWVLVLTPNALQKKQFCIKRMLKQCLLQVPCSSSWHPGCFTSHAHVPVSCLLPLWTQRGNPKPPSGCASLSPPLHSGLGQRVGRSVQCGPRRGEQKGPCVGKGWPPSCSALCRRGQLQTCLQRCTSVWRTPFSDT